MRPLLIDTNLLLLFLVGSADTRYIEKHKRLKPFDVIDFEYVNEAYAVSSRNLVCPNVLSETSNLIRYIGDPIRSHVAAVFRDFVVSAQEQWVPSATAVGHEAYMRLGLTDAVLLMLSKEGGVLLTVDLDLALAAERRGLDVLNYTYVRNERLGI